MRKIHSGPICNWMCRVVCVIIAVMILAVLWGEYYIPRSNAPKATTIQRLMLIENAIKSIYNKQEMEIFPKMQGKQSDDQEIEMRLWTSIRNGSDFHELSDADWFRLTTDGWGRRFRVAFRDQLIGINVAPGLTNHGGAVVAWSKGENGRDEFGMGDDVFIGKTN
jgi:hypothetical protein